jgi:lipoprotein NlpD
MKRYLYLIIILLLSGCATAPYATAPGVSRPSVPGIYHTVVRGETLWRISRTYGLDLDELLSYNKLPDASNIEVGQKIFIPNRKKAQVIRPDYSSDDFIWPIKGKVILGYGQVSNNVINKGLNIVPVTQDEVVAVRPGKVVFYTDSLGRFGKTLIIDHHDGTATVYSRNLQVFVRPGESVQKGQLIAKAGDYLHFEVRKGVVAQNPYYYLP